MSAAALGFAPHSGWAVVVAVGLDGGRKGAPRVLYRGQVEMADDALPGARQPYHALEGLPLPEAERGLLRFQAAAARLARAGVKQVVAAVQREGHTPRAAGILDSSGRQGRSLAAILAAHPLIHTADGEHFRAALSLAAGACGLTVARVAQKELAARAASALRQPADALLATAAALGKALGPPWKADHKAASLLAWMLAAGQLRA